MPGPRGSREDGISNDLAFSPECPSGEAACRDVSLEGRCTMAKSSKFTPRKNSSGDGKNGIRLHKSIKWAARMKKDLSSSQARRSATKERRVAPNNVRETIEHLRDDAEGLRKIAE